MRATTPLAASPSSGQQVKTPPTLKTGLLAIIALCLVGLTNHLQAQISVGANGVGPLTFDSAPTADQFVTGVLTGGGTTFEDITALTAGVATTDVARIVRPLPTDAAATPGTFSGGMRWNSALGALVSRPTTDGTNAAGVMVGKFVNNSGQARSTVILTYGFTTRNAATGALPGLYAYWSLTGAEGSWQPIPELSGIETNADLTATINVGSWAQGATLYILWVDDNANGITDPSYAIDNLGLLFNLTPPVITREPVGTNVVVTRTIRLSVVATGFGLSYQWYKDDLAIDPAVHPSATTPNLVITNAALTDGGTYKVIVANSGGADTSANAVVVVRDDRDPPVFVFASELQTTAAAGEFPGFRLTTDEPLCIGVGCSGDALQFFNWVIEETTPPNNQLFVGTITVNGNTIDFSLQSFPRDPTKSYRIHPADNGSGTSDIMDLFENRVPVSQSITAAPSRIFIQGVNGYTGTQDAEIHSNAGADTPLGTVAQVGSDLDDAGIAQGLFRFDGIFGNGADQIPPGARIVSATLSLSQVDAGSVLNVHRMLIPWDQANVTWNSLVDGVSADGVEAVTTFDTTTAGGLGALDVTASLQAWSDGQANNGWVFLSTGTDGVDMASSESASPPQLSVVYVPTVCPTTAPVITQNPQGANIPEGGSVTLTVGVSNACSTTYQWQKNGVNINTPAGTAGPSYTIANAVPGDSGQYRLVVTKTTGGAQAISTAAQVTVINDPVRPVVLRVTNSNPTTLVVSYSKVMGASAAVAANYTQNGVAASAAVLSADGRSVTVTTPARTFPTAYSLRIAGVTDNRATPNLIDPNPTIVQLTAVNTVVPWDGAWQYNTNNQDANANWKSVPTGSLDASWLTGNSLFGIETSAGIVALFPAPIATPLLPNTNTPPDLVTYYFRRDVTLPALPANTSYAINHFIDDGAVFYLDGVEIGRLNMAAGAPAYATKATSAGEAAFGSFKFNATAGAHVLAVEVHQGGTTTSSDMLFGAQIIQISDASPSLTISHVGTNAVVKWSADNKWELQSLLNSTNLATSGTYNTVTPAAGSALGTYQTPATATNQFFRLHYIGP